MLLSWCRSLYQWPCQFYYEDTSRDCVAADKGDYSGRSCCHSARPAFHFKSQTDFRVVAEATDGEETCPLCIQLSLDVLLLDLRVQKKDGLRVIAELLSRAGEPKPRIVVVTIYEDEEDIRRALNSGAKGYLLKGAGLLARDSRGR